MKAQDLKNSILQMAMEGKLVPQDSSDEPASVLLETIKEEKERLIKEKKIKRNNKESVIFRKNNQFWQKIGKNGEEECIDDELFEIPDSWEWCSLGDLFYCTSGLSYKKNMLSDESENMVRILRGGNINNEKYEFKDNDLFISSEHVKEELYLTKNTLITPAVSSLEQTGKIARIDQDFDDVVVGGFVLRLHPILSDDTFSKFYLNILSSEFHRSNCRSITRKSGQAFYNLSRQKLLNLPIVVPPLKEQERIVSKLNELHPFIVKYGEIDEKLEELNNEFLNKIKDSILQDAMRGKLVPQDSNDEPASLLLERIKEEKEKLIKEKKIKRNNKESFIFKENNHFYEKIGKKDPVCIDNEIPFDIPDNWEWCCMNQYLDVRDGTHDTPKYVKNGVPLITSKNLDNGKIDFTTAKFISEEDHKIISKRSKVDDNDILFAMIGTIGNPVLVSKDREFSIKNVALFKPFIKETNMEYIFYYLLFVQNQMQKNASGAVQSFVSLTVLRNYYLPLPPLNEQKRIVEKIEELFCFSILKN